jgi:hypothetical protein
LGDAEAAKLFRQSLQLDVNVLGNQISWFEEPPVRAGDCGQH